MNRNEWLSKPIPHVPTLHFMRYPFLISRLALDDCKFSILHLDFMAMRVIMKSGVPGSLIYPSRGGLLFIIVFSSSWCYLLDSAPLALSWLVRAEAGSALFLIMDSNQPECIAG